VAARAGRRALEWARRPFSPLTTMWPTPDIDFSAYDEHRRAAGRWGRGVKLPTVEEVAALGRDEIPAALCGLAALQTALAARLAVPMPAPAQPSCEHDITDDLKEVARITQRSVSWLRKHGHTLPGFRQPGGKGTRVAWSRRALEEWAARPTA